MRRLPLVSLTLLSLLVLLSASGCSKSDAAHAVSDANGVKAAAAKKDGDSDSKTDSAKKPGDDKKDGESRGGRGGRGGGGGWGGGGGGWGGGGEEPEAAVPVEVTNTVRRSISSYLETNGTLEAEYDVELIARAAGPIVELKAEEGMKVRKGQLLARIDPAENRARMEISRVNLEETEIAWQRAQKLNDADLLSQEAFEQARNAHNSAAAQFEGDRLLYEYTEIRAPFDGYIVSRFIKLAQHVSNGQQLFRVTEFDPLLCPIQVPERELPRLEIGQTAYVTAEAWPDTRFPARVLRISPVVDAGTGTVKVTLEVDALGKLRPGMFASVFLETERRADALVIPKVALSLESIGDTVYVVNDKVASRREVDLGFQEGDSVEIRSGLQDGDQIIVVGQDGLSEGTPIKVIGTVSQDGGTAVTADAGQPGAGRSERGGPGGPGRGGPGMGGPSGGEMPPEVVERMKERMKSRGMTDEQIEERLKSMREGGGRPGGGRPGGPPGGGRPDAGGSTGESGR